MDNDYPFPFWFMRGVSGLRRKSRPRSTGVGKAAGLNGFGNDRDLEVVELGKLLAGSPIGNGDAVEQDGEHHIAIGSADGLVVVEVVGQGVVALTL